MGKRYYYDDFDIDDDVRDFEDEDFDDDDDYDDDDEGYDEDYDEYVCIANQELCRDIEPRRKHFQENPGF